MEYQQSRVATAQIWTIPGFWRVLKDQLESENEIDAFTYSFNRDASVPGTVLTAGACRQSVVVSARAGAPLQM